MMMMTSWKNASLLLLCLLVVYVVEGGSGSNTQAITTPRQQQQQQQPVQQTANATNPATCTRGGSSILSGKKVVIVGGGPVGLYFATLLLYKDPTVQIEILEKRRSSSSSDVNAFGLGVGHRMKHFLQHIPGLYEYAIQISATIDALNIPLVSRDDLVQQMSNFLQEHYRTCRLRFRSNEECVAIDFDAQTIKTSRGRRIKYDLLVGADGVNSKIRREFLLHQEQRSNSINNGGNGGSAADAGEDNSILQENII